MRSRPSILRTVSAAALLAAGLGGCANLNSFSMGPLPVPADSPVAIAAREAARNPGPYPTFAAIPKADPNDKGPAPGVVGSPQANAALEAAGNSLRTAAAGSQAFSQASIDAYAAQQQAIANSVPAPPESAAADADAFARAARARATPPPPPK